MARPVLLGLLCLLVGLVVLLAPACSIKHASSVASGASSEPTSSQPIEPAPTTTTSVPVSPVESTALPTGPSEDFCASFRDYEVWMLETMKGRSGSTTGPTADRRAVSVEMVARLQKLEEIAPAELKAELQTFVGWALALRDDDRAAKRALGPELAEAGKRVTPYVADNCGEPAMRRIPSHG